MDKLSPKKAIHRWEQATNEELEKKGILPVSKREGTRVYFCKRCGTGPVTVGVLDSKSALNRKAVQRGITSDCNLEVVRKIQES